MDNPAIDDDEAYSCIGRGLISPYQVSELQQLTGLRSLCLHGNNLPRIEGISQLVLLEDLNLSSNAITSISGLDGLAHLTSLNVASNKLTVIAGLEGLSNLSTLNVSYNYVSSIAGLSALQGPLCKLRSLSLKHNQLVSLQSLAVLVGCIQLRELQIQGNPLCGMPNHLQALLSVLPQVTSLDGLNSHAAMAAPFDSQAAQGYATLQLMAFEHQAPSSVQQPQQHTPPGTMQGVRSPVYAWPAVPYGGVLHPPGMQGMANADMPTHSPPPNAQRQAPHAGQPLQGPGHLAQVQQGQAPSYMPQQQQLQHSQQQQLVYDQGPGPPAQLIPAIRATSRNHSSQPSTIAPIQPQQQQQQHQHQQQQQDYLQHQQQQQDYSSDPSLKDTSNLHQGPVDQHKRDCGCQQPRDETAPKDQRPAKPAYVDAGTQANEYLPALRKLQLEAAELRLQLSRVTDELESRNALEDSQRQQMADAVSAAQANAAAKVEDGFREASFAVSKALQELESARRSAAEASERAARAARSEEEVKLRCAGLDRDVARLHEELQRLHASHAAALDTERRHRNDHEHIATSAAATAAATSADLASSRAMLSGAEARATALEQKVASLEQALAQSSSVTVSMTSKIAQTMADANAQVDALKARVLAAEQALADAGRREAEVRAEAGLLGGSLAAAQAAHAKEVELMKRLAAEELRVALEKERSAAEERGHAAAALQAQGEKAALQEQLTFLKMQLQYALKESEKEVAAVQDALRAAQAETAQARDGLAASSNKQREGEALLADFTQVVQQQKSHIQTLQREKEALQSKLRTYAPAAFDALALEAAAAKKAASERDMWHEQAEDARNRWQAAERRLSELQVSLLRAQAEAGAQVHAQEAALAAAREDAARTAQQVAALKAEVEKYQDAVKIKVAMLDSANDTIASLKAEVADLQGESDELRRAADDAEGELSAVHERLADKDDGKAEELRSQLSEVESTLSSTRTALAEAQAKAREAEGRARAAADAAAEKDNMIKYVEQEVDRVKGLFSGREARLREERDAARQTAESALQAREAADAHAADLAGRLDMLAQELDGARRDADTQRSAARHAADAASAAQSECTHLAGRLSERESALAAAEDELRLLLGAVERQKAVSANKMKQLAHLLQEL